MMTSPPVDPEASDPRSQPGTSAAAVKTVVARGVASFGIVAGVGVAIGMAEYAAANGAYRPWTWIKVGFIYLLSFCGVGLHADSSGPSTFGLGETHLQLRVPMMVGTALVLWLLFRVGRAAGEGTLGLRATLVAITSAALAFAVPAFLVSLPATLRFPDVAGTISPVRWEAAVLPMALALGAAAAGALRARRRVPDGGSGPAARAVAIVGAGWHMFLLAVGFGFVGFLVLAAVKPDGTAAYARFIRDSGRVGAITMAHHLLLLPDQSIWVLGPAMGGSAQAVVAGSEPFPATATMAGINEGALGLFLDPTGEVSDGGRVTLGGGFYLFLLLPLAATVLGGRRAAAGSIGSGARLLRGAGAGVVFGGLVAVAALFSASALPLPLLGQFDVLPVSIRATMPSTALLALGWGVAGGAVGALTSRWPASHPHSETRPG